MGTATVEACRARLERDRLAAIGAGQARAWPLVGTTIDGKVVTSIGGYGREGERVDFGDNTAKWLTFSEIDALVALTAEGVPA